MKTAGIFSFGSAASPNRGGVKNSLGQGAHIVRMCCKDAGLDVLDLCETPRAVDVLMVSLYWWEHVYDLVEWLACHGIQYERVKRREQPILIVGGKLPSYNPAPFRDIIDLACIGDGEESAPAVLRVLMAGGSARECLGIPGVYVAEEDNPVEMQQVQDISATLRWPFYNRARRDEGTGVRYETIWERRIEIARGCRRKCAYCGVSWTSRYRENPTDRICEELSSTSGCVKCFAPDYRTHSGWKEIEGVYSSSGRTNQARDLSSWEALRNGFPDVGPFSIGIDGLSERIRLAMNKPLSRAGIVSLITRANEKMGQLGVYQILDMPGEVDGDLEEWVSSLGDAENGLRPVRTVSEKSLKRGFSADRFSVAVTLNSFCPTPHTPLQWASIHWQRDLTEEYMDQLEQLGPKENRRLKHKLLGRAHGATSRLLESVALRGGPQIAPFIFALARSRRQLVGGNGTARMLMIARKLGLDEHLLWTAAEKGVDEVLPWEKRVKSPYPRRALEAGWRKYKRSMGLI